MKTRISALIAASIFGLATLPASAFEAKIVFEKGAGNPVARTELRGGSGEPRAAMVARG